MIEPCCQLCRGSAPFFICRDPYKDTLTGCDCHRYAQSLQLKKAKRTPYRDPTAQQAVGNAMKGRNK